MQVRGPRGLRGEQRYAQGSFKNDVVIKRTHELGV